MSDTGSPEPLVLVSCPKGQVEKYVNVEAWILPIYEASLYIEGPGGSMS